MPKKLSVEEKEWRIHLRKKRYELMQEFNPIMKTIDKAIEKAQDIEEVKK